MTYRLRNIGIAVALAVLAALLTIFYVTNYKRSVQEGEELVTVFVAARDIPTGTSGSEVADRKLLKSEEVTRRFVVPGAISDPDQIEELVATEQIYAGEQVSARRFRPLGQQGIRAQLKGNLRAIDVPGSEHQLLLGTLEDGDRVDFVGSIPLRSGGGDDRPVTRVVLRDLLVLEAPSQGSVESKIGSRPDEGFSALLAVTDAQAQKLFHVVTHGDWSLQLRPVTDPADSPNSVDTNGTVLRDGLSRRELRHLGGR